MSHDNCVFQEEIFLPLCMSTYGTSVGKNVKCLNNVHFKRVRTVGVITNYIGLGHHNKGNFELFDYLTDTKMDVHNRRDTKVFNNHGLPPKRFRVHECCPVYVGDKVEFMGMVFNSRKCPLGYPVSLKRMQDVEFRENLEFLHKKIPISDSNRQKLDEMTSEPGLSQVKISDSNKRKLDNMTSEPGPSQNKKLASFDLPLHSSKRIRDDDLNTTSSLCESSKVKKLCTMESIATNHEKPECQLEDLEHIKKLCFTDVKEIMSLYSEQKNRICIAGVSWYFKYIVHLTDDDQIPLRLFGKASLLDDNPEFDFILEDPLKTNGLTVKVKCITPLQDLQNLKDRYLLLQGDMKRSFKFSCKQIMEFVDYTVYDEFCSHFKKEMKSIITFRRIRLTIIEIMNMVCVDRFLYELGLTQCKVIELVGCIIGINRFHTYLSDGTGIIRVKNDKFQDAEIGSTVKVLGGITEKDEKYNVITLIPFKVDKTSSSSIRENIYSASGFVFCLKLTIRDTLSPFTFIEDKFPLTASRISFYVVEFIGVVLDIYNAESEKTKVIVGDGTGVIEVYVSHLKIEISEGMLVCVAAKVKKFPDCHKFFSDEVKVLSPDLYFEHMNLLSDIYKKVHLPRVAFTQSAVIVPNSCPIPRKRVIQRELYLDSNQMRCSNVFRIATDKSLYESSYKRFKKKHCCEESDYEPFMWSFDMILLSL